MVPAEQGRPELEIGRRAPASPEVPSGAHCPTPRQGARLGWPCRGHTPHCTNARTTPDAFISARVTSHSMSWSSKFSGHFSKAAGKFKAALTPNLAGTPQLTAQRLPCVPGLEKVRSAQRPSTPDRQRDLCALVTRGCLLPAAITAFLEAGPGRGSGRNKSPTC